MNSAGVADQSAPSDKSERPTLYSVAPPGSKPVADVAKKRVAIFVAHGMGQQIPFETLDAIAESLRAHDAALTGRRDKPISNTIKASPEKAGPDQWLQRIELKLKSIEAPIEAHVYEGYWAPLTEGRITLRQVMSFLAGAAGNGLKIARKTFKRWLMGEYRSFPTPIRIVLYLLVALATVAALVEINTLIVTVAAARTLFTQKPWWLTDGLFADLTTTFNAMVVTMTVFGASLAASHYIRRLKLPVLARRIWGWVTVLVFYLTGVAIILAGIALAGFLFLHIRGNVAPTAELWERFAPSAWIDEFNASFDWWALVLALIAVALVVLSWVAVIIKGFIQDLGDRRGRGLTVAVALGFALVVAAAGFVVFRLFRTLQGSGSFMAAEHGIAWPILVAASAFARLVLVQYVGDVALYVMPYKVDAFNDLRKEIKETVYKVAHAVYALRDPANKQLVYDRVIVLGHSLGSVIAYDALNRLIHEDRSAEPGEELNVVARTPLFLTFGSPLDKTAFIFGAQGHGTTEAREALAASVQPLIQRYEYRPAQWINIYSVWDIISGRLDLYDSPGAPIPPGVDNRPDPDATTLLMAHTEYWKDSLLV